MAHAGGHGDLGGFALGFEARIERLEYGIAPQTREGGMVERGAREGPSTGDMTLTVVLATVVSHGRNADHGADGPVRVVAELGQARQQGRGNHGGYARRTGEPFDLLSDGVVALDTARDILLDVRDLPLERVAQTALTGRQCGIALGGVD